MHDGEVCFEVTQYGTESFYKMMQNHNHILHRSYNQ